MGLIDFRLYKYYIDRLIGEVNSERKNNKKQKIMNNKSNCLKWEEKTEKLHFSIMILSSMIS